MLIDTRMCDSWQEIRKNMKRYTSRFSLDDKMRESKASREEIERRRRLMDEYEGWAAELKKRFRQDKSLRLQLRNGKRRTRALVGVAEVRGESPLSSK